MDANTIADGIALFVERMGVSCLILLAVTTGLYIMWNSLSARIQRRRARRALGREIKPEEFRSFMGMH